MVEKIILVDENDVQVGEAEKMEAHKNGGKLHRCFSIFIFNSKGEMLLQRRGNKKYHFGGLWTNTCCGHPNVGEATEVAASRRLGEEMNFTCELKEILQFTYKATHSNGLTEWEYDHVFTGVFDGEVKPNPEEADGFVYMTISQIKVDLAKHPENYTPWFKIAFPKVLEKTKE
jgi:isopentenyl-diphosphate Delta-isomerase